METNMTVVMIMPGCEEIGIDVSDLIQDRSFMVLGYREIDIDSPLLRKVCLGRPHQGASKKVKAYLLRGEGALEAMNELATMLKRIPNLSDGIHVSANPGAAFSEQLILFGDQSGK